MVAVKSSFERAQRNLLAGIGTGAAITTALGAITASAFDVSRAEGAIIGCLVGAGAGAIIGELMRGRVISNLPEPLASERSFVGAHVPDDDAGRTR